MGFREARRTRTACKRDLNGREQAPAMPRPASERPISQRGSPSPCVRYVPGAVSYTLLYNCLDFPAGVVPVTTVTPEDEAQMDHYKGYFGDIWDKVLKKVRPP